MYARNLKFFKDKSFFLLGPRGTGKTMWVKATFPNALYFDLLKSTSYTELMNNPSALEHKIPTDFDDWVIIDEIQKIPELLNEVHRLIEERKIKFILTGSSARQLRKQGVNLLAGRAYTYHMYPMTFWELGSDFDLEKAIEWGLLPAIYDDGENPELYLHAYIQTYLREEVLQEGLTRNLAGFSRFLEVASFSQGETVNLTAIGRDAHLHRKVVESYFQILKDLLIGYLIPVFQKRAKRELTSHPKFYYFDVGIYQILRPKGPLDQNEVLDGAALETLFLNHLMALKTHRFEIFFWRTKQGQEVDFVLYGSQGLIAFEIKRTRSIHSKDLRALRLFLDDYPEARCFLVAGVDSPEFHEKITVLPFKQALQDLPQILGSDLI